MATTIIRSTDAAAVAAGAILTGNAGSLVAVLDHALVTRLGWTKDFSAANKGVYRAPSGVRHYLDVDDSGPDATALGRNARIRAYETMTAVGTGTNPFPTVAQVATVVGLVKSTATGTTARPWIIIGDDRTFYFFSSAGGTDPPVLSTNAWTDAFYFGEFLSAISGDLWRTVFTFASTTSTLVTAFLGAVGTQAVNASSPPVNIVFPRSYTGTGGSCWALGQGNHASTTAGFISGGGFVAPNLIDGGVYANLVSVYERGAGTAAVAATTSTGLRGFLRGLYGAPHFTSGFNDQDIITGVGGFAGKTFIALKLNAVGMFLFDTGTWAASS